MRTDVQPLPSPRLLNLVSYRSAAIAAVPWVLMQAMRIGFNQLRYR